MHLIKKQSIHEGRNNNNKPGWDQREERRGEEGRGGGGEGNRMTESDGILLMHIKLNNIITIYNRFSSSQQQQNPHNTVNREYCVSQNFHTINFRHFNFRTRGSGSMETPVMIKFRFILFSYTRACTKINRGRKYPNLRYKNIIYEWINFHKFQNDV